MWNENGALELLQSMPHVLTKKDLAELQQVIDNDKFLNSLKPRDELCGNYAPFCKNCDKTEESPCAVAYVRMKIKEGMEVIMEDIPSTAPEKTAEGTEPISKKIRVAIARKK